MGWRFSGRSDTLEQPIGSEAEARPGISWMDRAEAAVEVLLVSGVVSSPLAYIPFALLDKSSDALTSNIRLMAAFVVIEAAITFGLLALFLGARRQTLRDLGLVRPGWGREARIGIALVPLLFLANVAVAAGMRHLLPRFYMERNPLMELVRSTADLILFIGAALLAGGIKEEIQRAFILVRFRDFLGGPWLGLVVWSAVFGAGHYLQGLQGGLVAALFGFIFGAVYLARRNLIAPIVAHSVYDTAVLLGYWLMRTSS